MVKLYFFIFVYGLNFDLMTKCSKLKQRYLLRLIYKATKLNLSFKEHSPTSPQNFKVPLEVISS